MFRATGCTNDISLQVCFFLATYNLFTTKYSRHNSLLTLNMHEDYLWKRLSTLALPAVTFQILTDDAKKVIYRDEVRSALDHTD